MRLPGIVARGVGGARGGRPGPVAGVVARGVGGARGGSATGGCRCPDPAVAVTAMVRGIVNRAKRYVQVIASHSDDGQVTPLVIKWEDGRSFEIDYVKEARRATSLKVGGTGIRYLVTVCGKDTYLFYENPRWFVEEKVVEMP